MTATITNTVKHTIVRPAARTKRAAIMIEPLLASFDLSSDSSDGEQLSMAPGPTREKEQLPHNNGELTLRASGVHIRQGIGDESADVDIATTDGASVSLPPAESSQRAHSPRPATRSQCPPPTRAPATTAKARIDKCVAPMAPPAIRKEKPKSGVQTGVVCFRAAHPRVTAFRNS